MKTEPSLKKMTVHFSLLKIGQGAGQCDKCDACE